MSIRVDASGDYLQRSSDMPAYGTGNYFTACGFFCRRGTGDGSWETAFSLDAGEPGYIFLYNQYNTTRDFAVWAYGGTIADVSGVANTQDTWYFWAIVKKSGNTLEWYVKSTTATGWAYSKTGLTTSSSAIASVYMFLGRNNTYTEWSNGDHAGFRWWDAELTSDELLAESCTLIPRRLTNLKMWTPFIDSTASDCLKDYAGTGDDWTQGGTLSIGEPPPVGYGMTESGLYVPAGGLTLQYVRPIADIRTGNWMAN